MHILFSKHLWKCHQTLGHGDKRRRTAKSIDMMPESPSNSATSYGMYDSRKNMPISRCGYSWSFDFLWIYHARKYAWTSRNSRIPIQGCFLQCPCMCIKSTFDFLWIYHARKYAKTANKWEGGYKTLMHENTRGQEPGGYSEASQSSDVLYNFFLCKSSPRSSVIHIDDCPGVSVCKMAMWHLKALSHVSAAFQILESDKNAFNSWTYMTHWYVVLSQQMHYQPDLYFSVQQICSHFNY